MRLFYFLYFLTFSTLTYGQACTETTFNVASPGNIYNCTTLNIGTAGINKTGDGNADPLQIIVTGDVIINGNIIVDGANGSTISTDGTNGGTAGPGGLTSGGGLIGGTAQAAGFDPEDGQAGVVDVSCSSGGGGGGGAGSAGTDGFPCPLGSSIGPAGFAGPFPVPFKGGHGGGAGGEKNLGGGVFDLGGGGGGGGGLYINAGGTITIGNGIRISARGGRGGNSVNIGGAGGGGSGGNIHFISAVSINNQGIFDVRGGEGGGVRVASPQGGIGGPGGSGVIRLEVNGSFTDYVDEQNFSTSTSVSSRNSLSSDISCGTIVPKDNDQNLFSQMMIGFVLASIMGILINSLKRLKVYSR